MPDIEMIARIAEVEFADIVVSVLRIEHKIRITFIDKSFMDIYISQKLPDKFGFHWERKDEKGTFYRYDNFPDKKWQKASTYPHHFHDSSQDTVKSSPFPLNPIDGFRAFMEFVSKKIRK